MGQGPGLARAARGGYFYTHSMPPRPASPPQRPHSHGSPWCPRQPPWGAPGDQCHARPHAPLPESGYFLLHLPQGEGSPQGWDEEVRGTPEPVSKTNVGIQLKLERQEQNLGWGSPRQTWVWQVRLWRAGPGQGGRAHVRERSCSPPPQETLQSSQGPQEPHIPGPGQPGTSQHCRVPSVQVLGTGRGTSGERTPATSPLGPYCPARQPTPHLLPWAHQLSQGPVTTSPGSSLSQELSPGPADRLWFSGIPEGMSGGGTPDSSVCPTLSPSPHPTAFYLPPYQSSASGAPDPGPGRWKPEPGTGPGCCGMSGR